MDGRTLVGFDIRKSSSSNNLFMTSYDDIVRYEDIYERFQDYQTGLNLFFVDPLSIPTLQIPQGAIIVAFDLPTDLVVQLSNGNVSNPQPLPKVNIQNGWEFAGFDVVDPMTQTSAFHGFDLTFTLEQLIKKYSIVFNGHRLLYDMESAQKVADIFDALIPEHAPFSSCGIWLRSGGSMGSDSNGTKLSSFSMVFPPMLNLFHFMSWCS